MSRYGYRQPPRLSPRLRTMEPPAPTPPKDPSRPDQMRQSVIDQWWKTPTFYTGRFKFDCLDFSLLLHFLSENVRLGAFPISIYTRC